MRGHAGFIAMPVAALAAGLLASGAQPARAGQAAFCVTCKGPDQTYLCRVTGEDVSRSDALKLYCVVRMAKEGSHSSCAARNETAGCNGTERTYSYNGPSIPSDLAEDPRVKKLMERVDGDQKNFRNDKRKSLVEVTGEAMSASRRGLSNVRTSLGGGGDEASQSVAPSTSAAPSASGEALPDLPGERAAPLPSSAAPMPSADTATLSPDIITVPPVHQSRVRRGAQNVGHFARNGYHCVRSLFRHCRSESELDQPN
jgi:hypothetical protein